MDILEFTIIGLIVLFAVVKYMQHTTEQALNKRWKYVDFMKPILDSDEYSVEFKEIILSMFNDSMQKNLLLKFIFFGSVVTIFQRKKYDEFNLLFKEQILTDNKNHHKKFQEAIQLMIEINFYNAPHLYIIVGFFPILIIVIYSIFAKANKIFTKALFETIVFNTVSSKPICSN
ncbi:MAG: hypothetical protein COA44_12755 [Arcobacter sp.]|nr:MAG: hypothetical protein COA44_12755 [Arcobacter sp.]